MDDRAPLTEPTTVFARGARVVLALLVLGFAACMFAAARQYPGGTWCNPSAEGYQLLDSFFCDVLHHRGLNGAPNPGAPLARAALLLIALAFVPFWLTLPDTMELGSLRATLVRGLGTASALASLAVALAPSDAWPALHQTAVLAAAGTGITAAVLAATARQKRRASRVLRALAWCALTTAAIDAALYLAQALDPAPCTILLPALQKVAALFILAWMLGSAATPARGPAPGR